MRAKWIAILAGLVAVVAAYAMSDDLRVVRWENVYFRTSATANTTINSPVTGDTPQTGYIIGLYVDITGTGECTNFNLCALAGDLPARTLFSVASPGPSADTYYAIGHAVVNAAGSAISNTHARVPVAGQRLKIEAYTSSALATAKVYVVISDTP